MDVVVSFLIGVGLAGALAAVLLRRQGTRLKAATDAAAEHQTEAIRAGDALATAPDGFFLWDRRTDAGRSSRRLAVLLGLADGTEARFADVLGRFAEASRAGLARAVDRLRSQGESFEIDLELAGSGRRIDAYGRRGDAADLVWMRARHTAPDNSEQISHDAISALIATMPIPAWLRGPDLELVAASPAAAGLADSTAVKALAASASVRNGPASERFAFPAGGRRIVDVTEAPLPGNGGFLGYAVETSSRADDRASPPPATAYQALDNLTTGIAIFDAAARLVYANPAFATLWRLDPRWLGARPDVGEILDRLSAQRRYPEQPNYRAFREAEIVAYRQPTARREMLLHLPDGTTVRRVVVPHAGGALASDEDVTQALALERSLKTLAAVQKETLDHLYEAIAVFGSDGRMRLCNPAFAELWQLHPDEIHAAPHVRDVVERMRPFMADIADWDSERERMLGELLGRDTTSGRIRRGDGRILDYANVPLPDSAMLTSYLDVTDPATIEAALRERAEALATANRLNAEFIANLSFQARTPITTILGFSEFLSGEHFGALNPRQKDYAEGILTAARALLTVVGDVLDLALIEADANGIEAKPVDVHATLAAVLGTARDRDAGKTLKIELDCPRDIGPITADPARLRQILSNLLGNAIIRSPARGTIRISARREATHLSFAITDGGRPIPTAERERLFQPAVPGRVTDPGETASFGLALVKRFVELHGGDVDVTSSAAKGTTVTARLPLEPAA